MDPWLEEPSEWSGFHDILVVETVRILQPQLRARGYYAKPGERVWLVEPRRPIYPDVAMFRRETAKPASKGVAVLEADTPIVVEQAEVQIHESFVEIFDRANSRLVTGIEYVSPANKSDAQGRELYQRKQREMRDATVHLVEVDFIRHGSHLVDIPETIVMAYLPWTYLVNIVRQKSGHFEFYPIGLRERLPRIGIPLRIGDEDAVLDLQEVFDASYELGPYPERIVYESNPFPPLQHDDAAWADVILKSKGLRQ
jgi:hypothetical protein